MAFDSPSLPSCAAEPTLHHIGESTPDLAFAPVPTRRRAKGWTAEKQRRFIETLALTGSVADAAEEAEVDPRSAYRLRDRVGAEGFARAWSAALAVSATRLEAVVFDRALHGRSERIYGADGQLLQERRMPSDNLLKWLLARLDPVTFGSPAARAAALAGGHDPRSAGRRTLAEALATLEDVDPAACPLPRLLVTEGREREERCEGDFRGYGEE